jgi:hypothetical protein
MFCAVAVSSILSEGRMAATSLMTQEGSPPGREAETAPGARVPRGRLCHSYDRWLPGPGWLNPVREAREVAATRFVGRCGRCGEAVTASATERYRITLRSGRSIVATRWWWAVSHLRAKATSRVVAARAVSASNATRDRDDEQDGRDHDLLRVHGHPAPRAVYDRSPTEAGASMTDAEPPRRSCARSRACSSPVEPVGEVVVGAALKADHYVHLVGASSR